MSVDKRTVHTDALDTLGATSNIVPNTRDAVHIAVISVKAKEYLEPGDEIGFIDGEATTLATEKLGIVDPFIKGTISPGSTFWMMIFPRTITSLHHVWQHPSFDHKEPDVREHLKNKAREWIEKYANDLTVTFDDLIDAADRFIESGEYYSEGSLFDGEYIHEEFWDHYEMYTGKEVSEDKKRDFFSCSC